MTQVTALDADDLVWAWPDTPVDREPPVSEPDQFPTTWRHLDDVQLLELPDPEFLVEGVIQRGGTGVIYAPPGGGKTTLLAGLTTAIATGTDWFGHAVRHVGSSIYLAAEDPSGFKVRLRAAKEALGLRLDEVIGVYTFPEALDLLDPVAVRLFAKYVESFRDKMVLPLETIVVDTYASATPGASENSSEDTTTAMSHAAHWSRRLGVTVILAHHTNAGGSRERGHSAMRGAADFMIAMSPVDDVIHLECSKVRNAGEFDKLTLKLVPAPSGNGCVLRLASQVLPNKRLSPAQLKVYAALRDHFTSDGATKTEWQRTCHDMPERTFYHAAKVLVSNAFVQQSASRFRVVTAKAVPA